MSSQAFVFAHNVLPTLIMENPGHLFSVMASPGAREFLREIWERAGKECDPLLLQDFDKLEVSMNMAGATGLVVAIKLPEPTELVSGLKDVELYRGQRPTVK